MDTFENNDFTAENPASQDAAQAVPRQEPETPPQSNPYSGAGAGRKESPYANSPYVTAYTNQPQYQPPVKPKKEKKPGRAKRIVATLLILALVGSACGGFGFLLHELQDTNETLNEQVNTLNSRIRELEKQSNLPAKPGNGASHAIGSSGMTPAQLYNTCVGSVVAISSTIGVPGFYGMAEGNSSGSGFILSAEGYVVTNYHVVENATAVDVILHDGKEYPAEVVGYDSSNDIAVLKLKEEVEGLQAAAIGSSSDLRIGDMVVAIGNPLGELASTQTVGYISGINREVTTDNTIISMLQTDAAINPGNSGGPLFNMAGEVIGITTAKYSGTTTSGASIEGIGFAIPIDDVSGMISDLVDFGYVTGAYLGITVQDTDEESVSMYGLPTGAYVVTVVEGGSADKAGVEPKDIIIKLGDYEVSSLNGLTRSLRNFKAGDTTTITVFRSGREMTLEITLDERPRDINSPAQGSGEIPNEGDYDEWYDYFRRYFGG